MRDVDHLGFSRHNANVRLVLYDLLLWSIDKVACRSGLRPEFLNGIHNVSRLIEKGLAELRGPFEVLIHPFHNVRITNE